MTFRTMKIHRFDGMNVSGLMGKSDVSSADFRKGILNIGTMEHGGKKMDYKKLIELSKKAAAEWQGTHEYYQVATLITALCEATETLLAEREAAKWVREKDGNYPDIDGKYGTKTVPGGEKDVKM